MKPVLSAVLFLLWLMAIPSFAGVFNNPYPARDDHASVLYSAFSERPKHLDPARSYVSSEYTFIAQIYEPPLQYHYLKRPYQLVPLSAAAMPIVEYYSKQGERLANDAPNHRIGYTRYIISIKPGIYFAPHPAFVKNKQEQYVYHHLKTKQLQSVAELSDFKQTATRELTAHDFVYEIKRLADPKLHSPIFSIMANHIMGLKEYRQSLVKLQKNKITWDLREYPLSGATVLDRYHYQILIKSKYPQFIYWLSMPFFAPVPWEADIFYKQTPVKEKNITLDWYPVGTGAYQLVKNNPNRHIVMIKNPNFHGEIYPIKGTAKDKLAGYLNAAGKPMPFIDKVIFSLEKESIPRWSKFLQGYYDISAIGSDNFDQAVDVTETGDIKLSNALAKKEMRLKKSVEVVTYYWGFNLLDPVVGGYTPRAKKLRQAIAIAFDTEEFIKIFLNGRGIPAQGPIPPGIFGYNTGYNSVVYTLKNGKKQRRSLAEAKRLLVEAGYPNGRDKKTGKPLVLNYDAYSQGGPDDKARFSWLRKQFKKLNIQLHIRATQFNRYQEKLRTGNVQLYFSGWHADYPDPENFLFLLSGSKSKVKFGGSNASNYDNPKYNQLFEKMSNLENSPEREKIIAQLMAILREDSPWIFGFHPIRYTLSQSWIAPTKTNVLAQNTLKYLQLDPATRQSKRKLWNQAIFWPAWVLIVVLLVFTLPVILFFHRKEHKKTISRITKDM